MIFRICCVELCPTMKDNSNRPSFAPLKNESEKRVDDLSQLKAVSRRDLHSYQKEQCRPNTQDAF